ncbi:MAG: DUF6484 domain-containing protein [Bryobacterales bacterium]|nr:DUF6484 domain-containing protein [Bryobacterales bacterium]
MRSVRTAVGSDVTGDVTVDVKRGSASGMSNAGRGLLVALTGLNEPLVDFVHNPAGGPIPAITTIPLDLTSVSKEVVLVFEDGDLRRPIVIGVVQTPPHSRIPREIDISLDGRTLTLTATEEVVLRCGEASITLARSGKIVIKGTYLLSKARGANRIQGASVQLN